MKIAKKRADLRALLIGGCFLSLVSLVATWKVMATPVRGTCYVELKATDTIWDYYRCDNCGNTVSAKPDLSGRQACPGCGSPHTNEAYIDTPVVERGGKLYALRPVFSEPGTEENAQALSGEKFSCPWCSSSAFTIDEECVGCGARFDTQSEYSGLKPIKKSGANPGLRSRSSVDGRSNDGHASERIQKQESKKRSVKMIAGATALILGGLGSGGYWALQGYVIPGVVTQIEENQVVVSFEVENSTRRSLWIIRGVEDAGYWRIGEKVNIYAQNWGGPKGVERFNGDAFEAHMAEE
ncbi:MAG: hypothetical protein KDD35_02085 [Bdellovibrionales bacterium]|nr:hypothetical protein [Bdellovibrionales bacterium]